MSDSSDNASPGALLPARLMIGALQALALLLLFEAKDRPDIIASLPGWIMPALTAVAVLVPTTLLAGVGQLRPLLLALWTAAATGITVLAVRHAETGGTDSLDLTIGLLPPLLFVAYHLLAAASLDGSVLARYRTYFDVAWKNGVQLVLSLMFTGAFWLLLFLGGALFALLKIEVVNKLLGTNLFAWPATTLAFALAVHVSDVRAGLIEGARALALVLLSWLLPVMTLLAVAFLAVLPATGLAPLWATGNATSLLLVAAGALVVLINAAYQHGEQESGPASAIRIAARIAGLALVPVVAIAGYSIWLRVAQHGLTPDRVFGLAFVAVAGIYAAGYALAAVWPGRWMKPLEITNVLAGVGITVVIASLLTPVADPVRISVQDQVRRLQAGIVVPTAFDFNFLRFNAGDAGRAALEALSRVRDTARNIAIADLATAALKSKTTNDVPAGDVMAQIQVRFPAGGVLPESFRTQTFEGQSPSPRGCVESRAKTPIAACEAYLVDVTGDGQPEVLLSDGFNVQAYVLAGGRWSSVGSYSAYACGVNVLDALRDGKARPVPPAVADLDVGGQRVRMEGCPPKP